jgi:hypothetical protein
VQRSGIEYEFTWVIDMDIDHNAVVSKSRAEPLADLVENKPGLKFFQRFYDWLVIGEEPPKTKQDLVEFGASIGLEPNDIAEALVEAGIQFDPNPDKWSELTGAVAAYAEQSLVTV